MDGRTGEEGLDEDEGRSVTDIGPEYLFYQAPERTWTSPLSSPFPPLSPLGGGTLDRHPSPSINGGVSPFTLFPAPSFFLSFPVFFISLQHELMRVCMRASACACACVPLPDPRTWIPEILTSCVFRLLFPSYHTTADVEQMPIC